MAVRDILDFDGNVIGKLELPDDTSDEVFDEKLKSYITIPPSKEEADAEKVDAEIASQKEITISLYDQLKLSKVFVHPEIFIKSPPLFDLLLLLKHGFLSQALYLLKDFQEIVEFTSDEALSLGNEMRIQLGIDKVDSLDQLVNDLK